MRHVVLDVVIVVLLASAFAYCTNREECDGTITKDGDHTICVSERKPSYYPMVAAPTRTPYAWLEAHCGVDADHPEKIYPPCKTARAFARGPQPSEVLLGSAVAARRIK